MYGTEGNLFSANIPDENNQFNSWNFRDIALSNEDFLSLDENELAKPRGEDGSLPEVNFMKLNPNGPNYDKLKTIEEEMKNYRIEDDGTIVKINKEERMRKKKRKKKKIIQSIFLLVVIYHIVKHVYLKQNVHHVLMIIILQKDMTEILDVKIQISLLIILKQTKIEYII